MKWIVFTTQGPRMACNLVPFDLVSFAQCADFSGLHSNEMLLGATPSARHHSLRASYLRHLRRGSKAVRDMIVADIRSSLDIGASKRAADLLIVLRWFFSDHPEARLAGRGGASDGRSDREIDWPTFVNT